jgi:SpoVK/Ycf46/Vps4 family AAA+-type ATPase
MEAVIYPLFTAFATTLIPSADNNIKLQGGVLCGELLKWSVKKLPSMHKWFDRKPKVNSLYIAKTLSNGHANPIFDQMEEYIVAKHFDQMQTAQLIPKKGEMMLYPRKGLRIAVDIEGQPVQLCLNSTPTTGNSNDNSAAPETQDNADPDGEGKGAGSGGVSGEGQILLSSKTLPLLRLQHFVQQLCKLENLQHTNVVVYRPLCYSKKGSGNNRRRGRDDDEGGGGGGGVVEWDKLYMKTNKTVQNTIYSKKVSKDLFDDVEWFMTNEGWYKQRGISYKRSYLIHGPPGTGKTSVAKILANMYHLPIFVIDLQTITNNSDFTQLITEINYLTDKRYIVSIEDMDRCKMFSDRYYDDREQLSVQCFMNFLDGIVESHGRICLFSANEIEMLQKHPAMFRPGRIDCQIEITHCDKDQLARLYQLFYEQPLDPDTITLTQVVSPAQVVNVMTKVSAQDALVFLTQKIEDKQNATPGTLEDSNGLQFQSLLDVGGSLAQSKHRRRARANLAKQSKAQIIKKKEKELVSLEKSILKSLETCERVRTNIEAHILEAQESKRKMEEQKQTWLDQKKITVDEQNQVVNVKKPAAAVKRKPAAKRKQAEKETGNGLPESAGGTATKKKKQKTDGEPADVPPSPPSSPPSSPPPPPPPPPPQPPVLGIEF